MSLTKVPINDNEYKQSGSQFHQNDAPLLPKREYKMISKEKKTQLIRTVLLQKCKIKRIAKDLNINYATAKTILHNYRKIFNSTKRTSQIGVLLEHKKILKIESQNNSQRQSSKGTGVRVAHHLKNIHIYYLYPFQLRSLSQSAFRDAARLEK